MDIQSGSRARSSSENSQHSYARTDSTGSSGSFDAKRPLSSSPTVNVYTHCGRHSSQWLFSGWGSLKKGSGKKS